ncbi:MAG TPA: hypothetical protein PKC43_10520 [Phycisphaerales bacterium]|nr:hypothetical protein [Phycisphaerales bacterium]HMP37869.1 hypothetical protein [Phycisphaerales bacterium]
MFLKPGVSPDRRVVRLSSAILVFSTLISGIAAAQSVPGFSVTTYAADVPGPVWLSFAPGGTLFCGRDLTATGTNVPLRITRIGLGGAPVEEYGDVVIPDPDAVVYDAAGVVSGVPGSVLVGGLKPGNTAGAISAIRPNQTTVELFSSTDWTNPTEMKFDMTGRLVFGDAVTRTLRVSAAGEPPTLLATLPVGSTPGHLTIAPDNRIFVSDTSGKVLEYAADGTLLNGSYATFPSRVAIEFGPGGPWGTHLYALRLSTGTLHTIAPGGAVTQIGSGFASGFNDLAFGPGGRLYVARFNAAQILAIEPEACFCDPDVPADINCNGGIDGADLGLLLSAWGTADCAADLNEDGVVDGADLGLLLAGWGA